MSSEIRIHPIKERRVCSKCDCKNFQPSETTLRKCKECYHWLDHHLPEAIPTPKAPKKLTFGEKICKFRRWIIFSISTLLVCLFLIFFFSLPKKTAASHFGVRKIRFYNRCTETVYVGVQGNPLPIQGGWQMKSGTSSIIFVPDDFQGRFWARTKCTHVEDGRLKCITGDCPLPNNLYYDKNNITDNDGTKCRGIGGQQPLTIAEFRLNKKAGDDYYGINLASGYNMGINISPLDGEKPNEGDGDKHNCGSPNCYDFDKTKCFKEEQYIKDDVLYGCLAGNAEAYKKVFQGQCPDIYDWQFNNESWPTPSYKCKKSNYKITWCFDGFGWFSGKGTKHITYGYFQRVCIAIFVPMMFIVFALLHQYGILKRIGSWLVTKFKFIKKLLSLICLDCFQECCKAICKERTDLTCLLWKNFLLSFVSVIILVTAFFSPYWAIARSDSLGLWQVCPENKKCQGILEIDVGNEWLTIRTLHVLSIGSLIQILIVFFMFVMLINQKYHAGVKKLGIWRKIVILWFSIGTCIFQFTLLILYITFHREVLLVQGHHLGFQVAYGWAFLLAIGGFVSSLLTLNSCIKFSRITINTNKKNSKAKKILIKKNEHKTDAKNML